MQDDSDQAVDGIRFEDRPPPVADFIAMRAECGWGELSPGLAGPALESSLLAITALDADGRIAGFVRAIGDPLYLYIQDAIIAPERRGSGLGNAMMQRLLARIDADFPNAHVMLMCAKGREGFYARLGFEARPSGKFGPGMQRLR
ncbi:GNAT family N-acetyltransferase [uncultured Maricaulis sp.]|uniref:GNAT family N-acetyltransferase n=1 Tax=uncultured Maricaulis sp. TaxID=174710 RepID=UPI0030D7514D